MNIHITRGGSFIFVFTVVFVLSLTGCSEPNSVPLTTPSPVDLPSPSATPIPTGIPSSIDRIEQSVLLQINTYRASLGKTQFAPDDRISVQARKHSQDMANGHVPFGHDGFNQRIMATGIAFQAAAENVAFNQGYVDPATRAVRDWLNSSGHRQNIEGNYNLTGIGVAVDTQGGYYFTQIFVLTGKAIKWLNRRMSKRKN